MQETLDSNNRFLTFTERKVNCQFSFDFGNIYLFSIFLKHFLTDLSGGKVWGYPTLFTSTAWKLSVFGVILVRIFPHSEWIRRDTEYLRMWENLDQNNSEYRHLLRSDRDAWTLALSWRRSLSYRNQSIDLQSISIW